MFTIKRYTVGDKTIWNDFVEASKNGTFLLKRDYMDYHSDRFEDHSLLLYNDMGKISALLPANETCDNGCKQLFSHQGLTYGGLVLSTKHGANDVLQMFDAIISYLKGNGFSSFHYKQIPSIYHRYPSQEDEYALWRNDAVLEVCNISSSVALHSELIPRIGHGRKYCISLCRRQNYSVVFDFPLGTYWPILTACLKTKYDAKPVHTLQEMELLQEKFPDNIKCVAVTDETGEVCAGTVVYLTKNVAHLQYSCATQKGYDNHAIDLLYSTLLEHFNNDMTLSFFDFGTSNEEHGKVLNAHLSAYKETFGARGIAYKQWRIDLC